MLYFINATSFFSTDEVSDSKFFNWKSMMINVRIDLYYIVIFVSDLLKNNDVPCLILYACFVLKSTYMFLFCIPLVMVQ